MEECRECSLAPPLQNTKTVFCAVALFLLYVVSAFLKRKRIRGGVTTRPDILNKTKKQIYAPLRHIYSSYLFTFRCEIRGCQSRNRESLRNNASVSQRFPRKNY